MFVRARWLFEFQLHLEVIHSVTEDDRFALLQSWHYFCNLLRPSLTSNRQLQVQYVCATRVPEYDSILRVPHAEHEGQDERDYRRRR